MNTNVIQIPVRELLDTDTIVMNPAAQPVHVIREENLEITRQKYGITYLADWVSDGENQGRRRGCARYTDLVWVERAVNDKAAEIIAQSIAHESAELAAAAPEDRHYWDGWSPEKVRQGTPVIQVFATSPGLGRVTTLVVHLSVKLPDGTYSSVHPEPYVEKVNSRVASRRNGTEGYARRLAAKLHGEWPVEFKHHV